MIMGLYGYSIALSNHIKPQKNKNSFIESKMQTKIPFLYFWPPSWITYFLCVPFFLSQLTLLGCSIVFPNHLKPHMDNNSVKETKMMT